ncbi:MAG: thioredoxin family protein, partial [Saprospiraceae bacterium]
MKNVLIGLLVVVSLLAVYSFTYTSAGTIMSTTNVEAPASKVNWMTWEEAIKQSKIKKKKIFVDVYTDWCGWCKKMDKATFQKAHIAKYLNENYYPVKFNAEQKAAITVNNKTYKYVKSGRRGYHELAAMITRGKLSYPSIVFLDESFDVIQPIPGYQDHNKFEVIMTYFATDNHKKTPWSRYAKEYVHMAKRNAG